MVAASCCAADVVIHVGILQDRLNFFNFVFSLYFLCVCNLCSIFVIKKCIYFCGHRPVEGLCGRMVSW